jgi:uncharacterized protein YndB with AHSA1/START domain
MTVTDVRTDADARTLTITATFPATPERVWQMWADPRLLERWWGPPSYPATVVDHDLTPGGLVTYYMTGAEGDRYHGWWRVIAVDPPRSLDFEDGFADADGAPNPDMPTTTARVTITPAPDGGSRMGIESFFPTREAMDQLIAMGMKEGITAAIGQIDALVDGPA